MKSLILTTMTVLSLSAPALADARMDAYETCWSSTATKVDQSMKDYDKALDEAVARANKICHALARKAAETNGKDAVNETWHQMEVQFYNANASQGQQ